MKYPKISHVVLLVAISLVVLMAFFGLRSQAAEAHSSVHTSMKLSDGPPYHVPVGVFITSIRDLDFRSDKFAVTFWMWGSYDSGRLKSVNGGEFIPFKAIEIVNAQKKAISAVEQFMVTDDDGHSYAIAKFTAVINQQWDVRNFPFDRQDLEIKLESVKLQSHDLVLVPDLENSTISDEAKISGWNIGNLKMTALDYRYPSTFGIPNEDKGVFSRIVIHIPIQRIGFRLFINSFVGFFISFIIISMLYLLNVEAVTSRMSLIMPALFAAVGNKYTIDTYFPNQSAFGLSDAVQISSFVVIAIGLISTVICLGLMKEERKELVVAIDRWILAVTVPSYLLFLGFATIEAFLG